MESVYEKLLSCGWRKREAFLNHSFSSTDRCPSMTIANKKWMAIPILSSITVVFRSVLSRFSGWLVETYN